MTVEPVRHRTRLCVASVAVAVAVALGVPSTVGASPGRAGAMSCAARRAYMESAGAQYVSSIKDAYDKAVSARSYSDARTKQTYRAAARMAKQKSDDWRNRMVERAAQTCPADGATVLRLVRHYDNQVATIVRFNATRKISI